MELDDDMTKSFNVEESLIDLGTQSDSLLLESWNEIFRPDTAQQRIESIENSVLDYLDLGAIESTAGESSEIVPINANLIEFDREIRDNVHSGGTSSAPSNDEELKPIRPLTDSKIHPSQTTMETYPIPSSNARCHYSVNSAENNDVLLKEVKNMNYSFDSLQLSSIQAFVDEVTSDSQEANASGLSSTPGSSFSSYASSHKDQDLPQDILNGSLDGCLLHSIEETLIHLDEPSSSIVTNSLINGVEDDDNDDDEYVSWKKLETNDQVSDPLVIAPLEALVSDDIKSHLKDDPGKVDDEPCKEILQPSPNLRRGDNPAGKTPKLKNNTKKTQTNIGSKPPLKVCTISKHPVNQTKSSKMSPPKVVTESGAEKLPGKTENETKSRNSSDTHAKKSIRQSPTKVLSKSASPRASKSATVGSMSSSLTSQASTGLSSNKTVLVRPQAQNSVAKTSTISSTGTSSKHARSFIPSAREVKRNSMKPIEKVETKLKTTKSEPSKVIPVTDILSSASALKRRGMMLDHKTAVLTNDTNRQQNEDEDNGKQNPRSGAVASKTQTPGNSKHHLKESINPVNHSTLPSKKPLLSGKQVLNSCTKRQLTVLKGSSDTKAMKNAKNTMASGKKVS